MRGISRDDRRTATDARDALHGRVLERAGRIMSNSSGARLHDKAFAARAMKRLDFTDSDDTRTRLKSS
jgi:hypothetical protein